jgi:hypothetical protein
MIRGGGRFARGLAAAALIAVAATLLRGAAPSPAEAAQPGLSYSAAATWTADPKLGRVHVLLKIDATSHASGTGDRRYYFQGLQLTLPLSTADYVAADDKGQPLPVSVKASTPSGVVVYVAFRQRLYSGQSGAFELKFDVVDMGGSTDRDLRVGQDIISFPVSAFGSPGAPGSSVTVIFPAGFIVQEQFGTLTSSIASSGETVFSSGPVADYTALNAWFTASRTVPADFRVGFVTMGPLVVTLRYWSDDPGWADQVGRVLQTGYPIMRDLIGLGDPKTKSLTIEEATTQGISGFSGDYDPASALARVSYFADPIVILHEAAHMWFNGDLASDRWIDEGFASFYAEQVVLRLGLPNHAPALSASLMRAAVPLNTWAAAVVPGSPTEAYLYGASLEAVRRIAATAGLDGLRQVWAQALSRNAAYDRPNAHGTDLRPGGITDWRRLLDYLEQATDQSYSAIWQQWVVTTSQAGLLQDRDSARSDFAATEAATSGWVLPPDIRTAMGSWQFNTARALLSQAQGILGLRGQIDDAARSEGTTPPATLQTVFETGGTSAALAEAEQEMAALGALSAAREARTDSGSAARAVGLLGADPDADLAAARSAFAQGDIRTAVDLAESARAAWSGAARVGQIRILGTAAGTSGLLLLLALYVWTRSGRRDEDDSADAESGAGEQPDV